MKQEHARTGKRERENELWLQGDEGSRKGTVKRKSREKNEDRRQGDTET